MSLINEAATASLLSPHADERCEAPIAERLDQQDRPLARLERNVGIAAETLASFIRFWLTTTPALPAPAEGRAGTGSARYDNFIAALGRRLSRGPKLRQEILRRSTKISPEICARSVDKHANAVLKTIRQRDNLEDKGMDADTDKHRDGPLSKDVEIRCFATKDADAVCDLFVRVNRLLAPPGMVGAFDEYIARSLAEEIDHVIDYYGERCGGFWVAVVEERVAGMFGLEPSPERGMELRRMYVDPAFRRLGIARRMLAFAEDECRRRGRPRMDLSTSELQEDALRLYRNSGYTLVHEEIAVEQSNKALGGGLRRYHFTKALD